MSFFSLHVEIKKITTLKLSVFIHCVLTVKLDDF